MPRKTNPDLCAEFRALLTTGFHVPEGANRDAILAATKPWRGDLWKAFREMERRMCPQPGNWSGDDEDASENN